MFTTALRQRFFATVVVYNAVVYPIGVYLVAETNLFRFAICFIGFKRKPTISDPPLHEAHTGAHGRCNHSAHDLQAATCGAACVSSL